MTFWFCRNCGTKLKDLHWPGDDYRCDNNECVFFDIEVDSTKYKILLKSRKES